MRLVRVPTGAMMNTIIPGDQLVTHKSFGQIERGRIVVFQYPNDSARYVARVVGLPGETIQMRGNIVYINERPLEEQRVMVRSTGGFEPMEEISTEGTGPYRVFYSNHSEDSSAEASGDFATNTPFQLSDDSFFLLGDNRDNSYDSRFRGPVPRELIWGEPSVIYYSKAMSPGGSIRWDRIFKKVR